MNSTQLALKELLQEVSMKELKCYVAYVGNSFYLAISDDPEEYFDILYEIAMSSYEEASLYKDMIDKIIK